MAATLPAARPASSTKNSVNGVPRAVAVEAPAWQAIVSGSSAPDPQEPPPLSPADIAAIIGGAYNGH